MITAPQILLITVSTFSLNRAPSREITVVTPKNHSTEAEAKPPMKNPSVPAGSPARKAPSIMVPSISAWGLNQVITQALDEAGAARVIAGETVPTDAPDGWCLVTVTGFPLAWGKVTRGVCKNHFPKGLRHP